MVVCILLPKSHVERKEIYRDDELKYLVYLQGFAYSLMLFIFIVM